MFQFWVVFEIEFFGCTGEPEMLKKLIFTQNSKMYNYMHRSFALLCIFLVRVILRNNMLCDSIKHMQIQRINNKIGRGFL